MKNIHIIPTDKPSRLCFRNYYFINKDNIGTYSNVEFKNICITSSDEEIKEGDWFISLNDDESFMEIIKNNEVDDFSEYADEDWVENCKKIILTTDQDLINGGVQAIDNEFLEWFVKNPSCEEVIVTKGSYNLSPMEEMLEKEYVPKGTFDTYKIIIPKEEPTEEAKQRAANYMSLKGALEPKQEHTLEEVDENKKNLYYYKQVMNPYPVEEYSHTAYEKGFIEGYQESTKWLSERMYSEEDMKNAFDSAREFNSLDGIVDVHIVLPMGGDMSDLQPLHFTFEEWFEQFKKK